MLRYLITSKNKCKNSIIVSNSIATLFCFKVPSSSIDNVKVMVVIKNIIGQSCTYYLKASFRRQGNQVIQVGETDVLQFNDIPSISITNPLAYFEAIGKEVFLRVDATNLQVSIWSEIKRIQTYPK
jgi:hypothetical protein